MTGITTLTEDSFDEAMRAAPLPFLVDFWASGCAPCAALMPIIDAIAATYGGQMRFGAVKLDDAPALAARYQIMKLPTLIVFSGGRPAKRINDVHGRQQLLRELQEFLAS